MEIDVKTYNGTHESVKSAIELSDGFNNLKTGDSLVLKPNIFRGGGLFHKSILQYGPVTTSRIIKDTIISLKEYR